MITDTRELFARGFALATASHPVRLTERARRACRAAVRVSESAPDPSGLPKLVIGQLEGIWAVVYDRREAIEKKHAGAFVKILKAISSLDWNAVAQTAESERLINPDLTAEMLTGELRTRIINLIGGDLPADDRAAWQSLVEDALLDGRAEGQVAAKGILSGGAIDWELEAKEARAALGRGAALGDQAAAWIQRQVQGLGHQLSQLIARMWAEGAAKQEMLSAIQTMLGTPDRLLASRLLDTAIGQALSAGALETYAVAGVEKADFVTAGDDRVCADCSGAEDGNSYQLEACPQPPLHVSCRCTVAPSDTFSSLAGL